MNEGTAISDLEKLLDALPDDQARKRVLEWARAKYERKAVAAPVAPVPPIDWAKIFRDNPPKLPDAVPFNPTPTWPYSGGPFGQPLIDETRKCAFDGLPPGVYGLVCTCPKCSVICTVDVGPRLDLVSELAMHWTDEERARFTQCAGSIPTGTTWIGDGAPLPNTVIFRGIQ